MPSLLKLIEGIKHSTKAKRELEEGRKKNKHKKHCSNA